MRLQVNPFDPLPDSLLGGVRAEDFLAQHLELPLILFLLDLVYWLKLVPSLMIRFSLPLGVLEILLVLFMKASST